MKHVRRKAEIFVYELRPENLFYSVVVVFVLVCQPSGDRDAVSREHRSVGGFGDGDEVRNTGRPIIVGGRPVYIRPPGRQLERPPTLSRNRPPANPLALLTPHARTTARTPSARECKIDNRRRLRLLIHDSVSDR